MSAAEELTAVVRRVADALGISTDRVNVSFGFDGAPVFAVEVHVPRRDRRKRDDVSTGYGSTVDDAADEALSRVQEASR